MRPPPPLSPLSAVPQVLVDHDVEATARLILSDFPLELAEVTYKLHSDPAQEFHFLHVIFDPRYEQLIMLVLAGNQATAN